MSSAPRSTTREPLEEELSRLARALEERRGRASGEGPTRLFFSPGRVNLMGAHLDYNGGPVLPMAIDRGTFLAIRPRADRRIDLAAEASPEGLLLDLDALPEGRAGAWYDYPVGVVRALLARVGDGTSELRGADVLFGGNLPIGAGLSSSASICVGTAHALDRFWGLGLDVGAHVQAALWAEREYVGVRCGIMDPYAVGLARPDSLLWLDCKDVSTEHVPLDTARVCIAVADTGVRRELAAGAFNERVGECVAAFEALRAHATGATCLRDVPLDVLEEHVDELPAPVALRARHVLEEVQRTFAARSALRAGDLGGFGAQMSRAHVSLREKFEVSVPELDSLVDAALEVDGAERLPAAHEARFGVRPPVEFFSGDPGPREVFPG
jgi:galactokinase